MNNTLHFNLIRQWWEAHQNGKEDEYREITRYWVQRLFVHFDGSKIDKKRADHIAFLIKELGYYKVIWEASLLIKPYDICELKNGYHKDAPVFYKEYLNNITVDIGKPEWGAPDYPVFCIKLGKIIEK